MRKGRSTGFLLLLLLFFWLKIYPSFFGLMGLCLLKWTKMLRNLCTTRRIVLVAFSCGFGMVWWSAVFIYSLHIFIQVKRWKFDIQVPWNCFSISKEGSAEINDKVGIYLTAFCKFMDVLVAVFHTSHISFISGPRNQFSSPNLPEALQLVFLGKRKVQLK